MRRKYRLLVLLFVLVIAATGCMNDQQPVQSSQQNKKEKVPEYVLTKEIFKDGNGGVDSTVEYNYDDQGHLIEVIYRNGKGEIIEHKKYKYNDQGLKVKRKILEVVEPMNKHRWMSGSYDLSELDKERVIHEDMYMIEGTSRYKYNSQNQLVYFEKRNKKGKKVRWIKFKYYDNGNMKLEHIKRSNGYERKHYFNRKGKEVKEVKKYDGNIVIKKDYHDQHGNLKKTVTTKNGNKIDEALFENKYDSKGNLIKTVIKDKYHTLIFKYNKEGKKTKYVLKDSDGDIEKWREYKYNEKGKKSFYVRKNSKGKVTFKCDYNYKYDENGNLIEDNFRKYKYKKLK